MTMISPTRILALTAALAFPHAAFAASEICPRLFPWSESRCDGFFADVVVGHPMLAIPLLIVIFGTMVAIAMMIDPSKRSMQVLRASVVAVLAFPLAILLRVFVWGSVISLYSLLRVSEASLLASVAVWAIVWFAAVKIIFRLIEEGEAIEDSMSAKKKGSSATAWLYAHATSGGFLFWAFLVTEGW